MLIFFKKLRPVISLILVLLLLCGCGEKQNPSPSDISKLITETGSFSELNSLSGDRLPSYFQFKNADVKRFSVFMSNSTDSADTIAIFEVENEENYNLVVTGLSQYVSKLSSTMYDSVESEYAKIRSSLLMHIDNTIILVICADSEKIKKELISLGAEAIY